MRTKVNMIIPADILELSKAFEKANMQLFVVGGAVRDFLLGKTPHDFDLVTNALPYESKAIISTLNNPSIRVSDEQGKSFGVLRIFTDDCTEGYELATYRRDISSGRDNKGTNQKVEIGHHITIENDVNRRDFSINALFYDIQTEEIVDLVGGIDDLKNKTVRAVGDPKLRFYEDRLRILRGIRISVCKNFQLDENTKQAILHDNRLRGISDTDDVSQERIIEEFNKTLSYARDNDSHEIFDEYLKLLHELNLLVQMFPSILYTLPQKSIKSFNSGVILAVLFELPPYIVDSITSIREIKNILIQDLCFSEKIANRILFLQQYKAECQNIEKVFKLALMKNQYSITNEEVLEYIQHYFEIIPFTVHAFLRYCTDGFVIDGNDLIAEGFKGKEIGLEKEKRELERFSKYYLNI